MGFRSDANYAGQALDRWYLARVVRADSQRDLAVLQIYAQENGATLPNSFRLKSIPLGRTNALAPGAGVATLSFPGAGAGRTLAGGEGQVVGFVPDTALGYERGWIQTDVGLTSDNIGALLIDGRGDLVGIYTGARGIDTGGYPGTLRAIEVAEPLLAGAR